MLYLLKQVFYSPEIPIGLRSLDSIASKNECEEDMSIIIDKLFRKSTVNRNPFSSANIHKTRRAY